MPAGKEKAGRPRLVVPLSGWVYKRMRNYYEKNLKISYLLDILFLETSRTPAPTTSAPPAT